MTSTTSTPATPGSIEATAALLRSELPQLEAQQQTLEKELSAVTGRLDSVRTALTALQTLSVTPAAQAAAFVPEPTVSPEAAPAAAEDTAAPVRTRAPRKAKAAETTPESKRRPAAKAATAKPAKAVKATAKKADAAAEDDKNSGLTEQILDVLAKAGSNPVRAREVAQVLGRDETPGSINAVRSTLDRLVGSSRAHRAGRGLYQASSS
ncbi:hypothetical protein [Streptomyces sp. NPDC088554]|uniref:hypothetical protein n=1 Tax=Streptomyces sp. NPDC088554 TaxID=3365865 RepID=UPI0038193181